MLCKIADLIVEVPAEGGLDSRCRDYLYSGKEKADIVIKPDWYRYEDYGEEWPQDMIAYLESGWQFTFYLSHYSGFYLHASAVAVDGRAYLFSADSGVGKSTHAGLWQQLLGDRVKRINDDKPALRCLDGVWYAYGTPWCGKDGINQNVRVPLGGICFLKRGSENRIRCVTPQEAAIKMMGQTTYSFQTKEKLDKLVESISGLLSQIPVFELVCRADLDAARLSYETMCRKAEEMGL